MYFSQNPVSGKLIQCVWVGVHFSSENVIFLLRVIQKFTSGVCILVTESSGLEDWLPWDKITLYEYSQLHPGDWVRFENAAVARHQDDIVARQTQLEMATVPAVVVRWCGGAVAGACGVRCHAWVFKPKTGEEKKSRQCSITFRGSIVHRGKYYICFEEVIFSDNFQREGRLSFSSVHFLWEASKPSPSKSLHGEPFCSYPAG